MTGTSLRGRGRGARPSAVPGSQPEKGTNVSPGSTRRSMDVLFGVGATAAVVGLWQAAESTGLISPQVIPGPVSVARAWETGFGIGGPLAPMLADLAATAYRLAAGFAVGAVIGIGVGIFAGTWKHLREFLEPLVATANVIPAVITLPVIALFTGVGDETIVLVAAYSTAIPVYRGAIAELRHADAKLEWAARGLGAHGRRYFTSILAPLALIGALKTMRVALGYAWRASIAAEILVVAQKGLGSLTFNAHQYGNIATMLATLLTITLVGLVLDAAAVFAQSQILQPRGLISQ